MKTGATSFAAQSVFWAWRGVLCAAPSFFWAYDAGYRAPHQIVAMLVGIATFVVAFAWITSRLSFAEGTRSFAPALRLAGTLRAGYSCLAALAWCKGAPYVDWISIPDFWSGMVAIACVAWIGRSLPFGANASSLGWIYVTTLFQGALVSATMLIVARILWLFYFRRRWRGGADVTTAV